VLDAQRVFADIGAELGVPAGPMGAIATPVNWYQYTFIMGGGFLFGDNDYSVEGKARRKLYLRRLLEENAKMGYGEYRAPPIFQDAVADQYSFNDHVLRRFHETLKDAIDPNGILSPGRGGIWPQAHREQRGRALL